MNKSGYCPLASGSKGNSLLFRSQESVILIDAGLSGRATLKKLDELGVSVEEIDAILISHDHSDHIQGLKILALKHHIPILANRETAKGIYEYLRKCPQFKLFTTGESFTFQDIEIHPFSVQHDTADPVAFTLKTGGVKVGICTDLGFATSLVKTHLQECDFLHLEANHDPGMVHACSRPMVYKQRVLGRSGHLSNAAAAELLQSVLHKGLKHVHLAHLSEECNHPDTALETVRKKVGSSLPVNIAWQHQIGEKIDF